jgi:ubiquinone/menaquinone biosynthesis C-methylase UbiE
MPNRKTSWNQVAKWYDKHVGDKGSDFHQQLVIPGALKLLAPKKGDKILDVACGQGVLCRQLARLGAAVFGVDASKRLIELAKKHSNDINYAVEDATKLSSIQAERFDAASCILAIQNIDPLDKIIAAVSRILKKGGRFLIVMNHPCFRIPRQSGWGTDAQRKLQYRRVDSYLTELKIPIKMHPGASPDIHTWSFHRPLMRYFEELHKNNFAVTQLEEWASHRVSRPGKNSRQENRARDEIPMFLAILAIKAL